MTYCVDFRRKVLLVREKEGLTFDQVAARFHVGKASVVRWAKHLEPQLKRNKPATKIDMDALRKDVQEYPDAYNYERAKRLGVSPSGIFDALKRLGVTYKKNPQTSQGQARRQAHISVKDQSLPKGK